MSKYPTLYHGTDDRILKMSDEERKAFKNDCIMVSDYLWSIFKPYYEKNIMVPINVPGYEGCTGMERKLYEFKDAFEYDKSPDDYITLCYALSRQDARISGNEQYDYSHIYLSNQIERAKSYARRSSAFGEIGLTTLQLIEGEKKINLPEFNPDEKTIAAIHKISSFAKEDAIPVVVELSDYDPETILFDNGRPLEWELVHECVTLSLRCIVDIKLNELKKYYI